MAILLEDKTEQTRHLKVPHGLDQKIRFLAKLQGRPITEQYIHILDIAVNGPRELRVADEMLELR